ncbi:hypothetical protein LTS07_004057 [Exophiala sideris]|uniref:Uncharacterized protein n=1 Tax=Exophiala sideris TaxID=1016849 RepID=A0ABR0JE17_9EURO|nr:hypothetical protein LTS07_004057 [Exophiala sideris]KAK5037172.1 hypothetical protein LTR13_004977 [Exophiala sideris]KAK5062172.1 hypothetical protein LTR69_004530 [Exophiala sideris]KAK5182330.1 hypothetical protein LTR44_005341 [Eurotiomycetes sp. CCFEE 6388]
MQHSTQHDETFRCTVSPEILDDPRVAILEAFRKEKPYLTHEPKVEVDERFRKAFLEAFSKPLPDLGHEPKVVEAHAHYKKAFLEAIRRDLPSLRHQKSQSSEQVDEAMQNLCNSLVHDQHADLLYKMLCDVAAGTSPTLVLNAIFTHVVRNHLMRQYDPHELKVGPQQGTVQTWGNVAVPLYGTVDFEIRYNDFCAHIEAIVADQWEELLLGRPFWEPYRVVPDYATGGIIIHENEKQWHVGLRPPPARMQKDKQTQAATRGKERAKSGIGSKKVPGQLESTPSKSTMDTNSSYLSPTESGIARSQAGKQKKTRASLLSKSSVHRSADSATGKSPTRETEPQHRG